MNEARAYAAGYVRAIRLIQEAAVERGGQAGYDLAVHLLERNIGELPGHFESWKLSQDPAFQESLGQMMRGEGREITREDLEEIHTSLQDSEWHKM
jgi:hypothetical protein